MSSYYFNLPAITSLTIEQQSALKSPLPIALSGGPGTGKSVVSLYRHITRTNSGKSCQLLTYTTTLALYLRSCCVKQNAIAASNVSSTYKWSMSPSKRDEIIIDEAQDVNISTYKKLQTVCAAFSYGADENQSLYPDNACSLYQLKSLFGNTLFTLSKNYRNTRNILRLAYNAFPNANISQQDINSCISNGNMPILIVTNESKFGISNNTQDKAILDVIKEYHEDGHNIAILCPWGKAVDYFYNMIVKSYPATSYYYNRGANEVGCKELNNIHVTTFKSAKGLEFDTVIIPNFHNAFDDLPTEFHVDWKDFYVGVTRAKTNLFLISYKRIFEIKNCVDEEQR